MIVVWDPKKALANQRKHGISFEEGLTVLESERQLIIEDFRGEEQRFIALGYSSMTRMLVVVYCYRYEDVIRIISARKATKREKAQYEERI